MGNEHSQLIDDFCVTAKSGSIRGWIESLDLETRSLVAGALKSDSGIVLKFPRDESSHGSVTDRQPRDSNSTWPRKADIKEWSENLDSFWDQSVEGLQLNDGGIPWPTVLAQIYDRSASTDSHVGVRLIQRRHIQMFWYKLLIELFPMTCRGPRVGITKALCEKLAQNFFSQTKNTLSTVTEQIFADAIIGKRYHTLVEKFGSGILVVLPSELEKHITIRGSSYSLTHCESGIEEQGLVEHAVTIGADAFSRRLFSSLFLSAKSFMALQQATSTPSSNKRKHIESANTLNVSQWNGEFPLQVVEHAFSRPEETNQANVDFHSAPENSSHMNFQYIRTISTPQTGRISTDDIDTPREPDVNNTVVAASDNTLARLIAHPNTDSSAFTQSEEYSINSLGFPLPSDMPLGRDNLDGEEPFFVDNLGFPLPSDMPLGRDNLDGEEPFFVDNLDFGLGGSANLGMTNRNLEQPFFLDSLKFQQPGSTNPSRTDPYQEDPFFVDGLDFQLTGNGLRETHLNPEISFFNTGLSSPSGYNCVVRGLSFSAAPHSIRA